ncbi:MAG: GAF domain-containing protein [Anaerolineae bacterium]
MDSIGTVDQPTLIAEGCDTTFLESTVRQATLLLRATGSAFFLCDPRDKELSLVTAHGLTGTPWEQGLLRQVCQSREPVFERCTGAWIVLAVPCLWRETIRGVLIVADEEDERVFDDSDIALLQPLADLAAAALRQAERLARMTAQFRALHVIDIALTSSLQLDRVLNLILEKAVFLVGAEHGSLRLYHAETGELVLKAHLGEGWTPDVKAHRFRLGRGITGWVAKHRQPYLCHSAHDDPQNVLLFEEMQSGVAVPLLTRYEGEPECEELLGVLLLESTRPYAFDQRDVELLEALAQEAVIAIQNATQHQKLQLMHQALLDEQERRVAAEKWTVMGQTATALAHRINNLIGILPVSAAEVRRTLKGLEIPPSDRQWIVENLDRIEHNARFVLRMSDALFRPFQEPGPPAHFHVNRLLTEALQAANLPPNVQVILDLEEELPPVESSSLLVDIFLELITNARKAMDNQPRKWLEIRTRLESDNAGRWVAIEISDTGQGITSDQIVHLWDMFKPSADGLGFGLWWVRTFIERQGGTIVCDSRPGAGATFTVRLPAQDSHALFEA